MIVTELMREFHIDRKGETIKLPDPNPEFTPQEVMDFYSGTYAELTTASWNGPTISNDKRIYTFTTVIGNKG